MPKYDYRIKILTLGAQSVGKTSLINRQVDDNQSGDYSATIGIDFKTKLYQKNEKSIHVSIWDTAGQDRQSNITSNQYKNVQGIILVYDITNEATFNRLDYWIDQITTNSPTDIELILLGNKNDLETERVVSGLEQKTRDKLSQLKFNEVSAKTGDGVKESFEEIIDSIVSKVSHDNGSAIKQLNAKTNVVNHKDSQDRDKKKGCSC